jgi:NCAIR mutase (PurE)-related protein
MEPSELRKLLEGVQRGEVGIENALDRLRELPFKDLGFANLDMHRSLRQGFPEVVLGQGKTAEQVARIVEELARSSGNVLVTRLDAEKARGVCAAVPAAKYDPVSRTLAVRQAPVEDRGRGPILVVSAGTSDMQVAEEAAVTAEVMGNRVDRLYDVGVAGIHRLLHRHDRLRQATVVVVVAGMEGALASVVGGLVAAPVIAVPTSVGYGASFQGLAALLGMLNSCSSGVAVVNIDNGFGAATVASLINRRSEARA